MTDEQSPQPSESENSAVQWNVISAAESARLREMEILAQVEAEQYGTRLPTDLILLLLAPLLLLAVPLVLFVSMRGRPAATPSQPAASAATQFVPVPASGAVAWQTSFEAAQQIALSGNKNMMVDFYTDWCGPCRAMDENTYPDASIVQESQNVVPVKINADNFPGLVQRYNVTGYPTIVWMDASGTERGRIMGGMSAAELLPLMQQYR